MLLIKEINGVPSPYSLQQLYNDYYYISWPNPIPPKMLASYDVYYVVRKPAPEPYVDYDPYQQEVQELPVRKTTGGQYVMDYSIVDKPSARMKRDLRKKRDDLLLESDGLVLKTMEQYDYDMERIHAEGTLTPLKEYRQKLRDVPQQESWPFDLVWPDKPV